MKLIIDIPEENYNEYKKIGDSRDILFEAIRNGTPLQAELEEIKAEIENIPNDETTKPVGTYDYCLGAENERKVILEILDNHIKELNNE